MPRCAIKLKKDKVSSLLTPLRAHYNMTRMATRFQSISSLMQSLIQEMGLQKEMDLYRLETHWEEVVGRPVASHTVPDKIYFHTLSLLVDSAPWMHQLSFFKKEIIEKANHFLGQPVIREVHFKMAPIPRRSGKGISASKPAEKNAAVPALNEEIARIPDEETKKIIQRAMDGYFGH